MDREHEAMKIENLIPLKQKPKLAKESYLVNKPEKIF
jgi:hypothetical protein